MQHGTKSVVKWNMKLVCLEITFETCSTCACAYAARAPLCRYEVFFRAPLYIAFEPPHHWLPLIWDHHAWATDSV